MVNWNDVQMDENYGCRKEFPDESPVSFKRIIRTVFGDQYADDMIASARPPVQAYSNFE